MVSINLPGIQMKPFGRLSRWTVDEAVAHMSLLSREPGRPEGGNLETNEFSGFLDWVHSDTRETDKLLISETGEYIYGRLRNLFVMECVVVHTNSTEEVYGYINYAITADIVGMLNRLPSPRSGEIEPGTTMNGRQFDTWGIYQAMWVLYRNVAVVQIPQWGLRQLAADNPDVDPEGWPLVWTPMDGEAT